MHEETKRKTDQMKRLHKLIMHFMDAQQTIAFLADREQGWKRRWQGW